MTLKVIVLDDDSVCLQLVERLFRGSGYQVDLFSSVAAAKTAIAEDNVDLMLIDYRMPGVNGVEFVREIRKLPLAAGTRICVWSSGMLEDRNRAVLDGHGVEIESKDLLRDKARFLQFCAASG